VQAVSEEKCKIAMEIFLQNYYRQLFDFYAA